ncbi:peptide/nickel transport system permease protein [Halogranum rubrum]|uniref:Peptide/nickel transport system permease protein n=2 Tax=Halogranum rubrum TaxID=553466 RepID=A0A1I4HGQ6_9EURY|nr:MULTISPECIES: ABC transporter permease [Halogranum]EJN59884.1 dipeptide ABC transporter permease [Halogranum salarium B-1]SFL40873.1 peptide/nickel transport system permease protein [Halogranum rubrum]
MSRWQYFLRRILLSIPVVLFGTTVTFMIIRLGPLDPAAAILGPTGDPAAYDRIREQLGLTQPLWQQYFDFLFQLFTFDLGNSWVIGPGRTAYELILIHAPRTIWLGFWSVLIALFVGIPLGFYAGLNPNTFSDYTASFGGIVWRAMPNFWLAIIFVSVLSQSEDLLFGFEWSSWLVQTNVVTPPSLAFMSEPLALLTNPGDTWPQLIGAIKQIAPAAIVLGSSSMGNEMRIGRTAVLETINSNYVETARAKGVSNRTIVWKHVFRNALIPLVPIITGEAFLLIGGSVLVETVFAINGLGWLFFQAAIQGDLPLVGSLMFIFILILVGTNILQDFLYTIIDPRVGYDQS